MVFLVGSGNMFLYPHFAMEMFSIHNVTRVESQVKFNSYKNNLQNHGIYRSTSTMVLRIM